jgi:hypothetical protein
MKRFDELSNQELLEMANKEELSKLIDLECAYQSVPLLPVLPEMPEKKEFPKDVTLYSVGNFKFFRQSEAMNVVDLLNSCELTDTSGWGVNEKICSLPEYNKPKIEVKNVYSKEKYAEIEADLKAYEKQMSIYNDLESEYKKVEKQRKEIEEEIYDRVEELRKEEAKLALYKEMFARYLELAGGNKEIALNFLNNAYPDAVNYPEIQELAVEGGVK